MRLDEVLHIRLDLSKAGQDLGRFLGRNGKRGARIQGVRILEGEGLRPGSPQ
ncbi:hypothetical protein T261_8247 [Streptomyces lydicus]|nr:hypothetical protein T261_8247 [Streptomyces lydicus]